MSTEKLFCKSITVGVRKYVRVAQEDLRCFQRLAQRFKDLERPIQQARKPENDPVYLVATHKLFTVSNWDSS